MTFFAYSSNSSDTGITTTLNCTEEYLFAKKILQTDKFANQVKFAKGGGEAMAIAIRLARSYSDNDEIAFSGYHGWHDWYLATNLQSTKNLNKHLLSGLEAKGVPNSLKTVSYTHLTLPTICSV